MVELEIKDGIATVTLNRPEKLNALNFEAFRQLDKIIKQLKRDQSLRFVIIKGAGDDFCTGLDVSSVFSQPKLMIPLLIKWLPFQANLVQRVVLGWQQLQVPVFAQVQGRCYGAGCQLIAGVDYVVATPDAEFAIMEARWGLCPDMAASHFLAQKMRYDDLLWLSQSATPISALEAKDKGLITDISDNPEGWVKGRLEILSKRSPDTLAAIKRIYQTAYQQRLGKTLLKETYSQIRLLLGKNLEVAIKNGKREEQKDYKNPGNW